MKKNINNEVFREYFGYQSPSFLAEDLLKANNNKNKQIVKQTIDSINELKNSFNIAERNLEFNKHEEGK